MAQTALIQVRVEKNLKDAADKLFNDLGLDTTTAVRIFLHQAIDKNALPFLVQKKDDPFYSAENQAWLEQSVVSLESGHGHVHELIEN